MRPASDMSVECQMPDADRVRHAVGQSSRKPPLIGTLKVPAVHHLIREASTNIALYVAIAVVMAVGSLYFAWRNRDFRKFLAGWYFVLSLSRRCFGSSVGTGFVEAPQISG